ncbi:ASCH domain-containing protein [Thermus arciformis]|nr:ASCH domain-containing protein [Thermus arciformis]
MIRFRGEYLEAVASGRKTCTLRFKRPKLQPGDRVRLAFGRRDRPTILEAVVREVAELHIPGEVEVVRVWLEAPTDEEAERLWETMAAEQEGLPSPSYGELLDRACQDSGTDLLDLLVDMVYANTDTVWAIWFEVVDA